MKILPDSLWLEPTDLGFANVLIGAGASLAGKAVPWASGYAFSTVVLFLSYTGTASSVTVRSHAFDFDGITSLETLANLWATVTGSGSMAWYKDNLARASIGTVSNNDLGRMQGAPYTQFDIVNNDGVNTATVTMRAHLRRN